MRVQLAIDDRLAEIEHPFRIQEAGGVTLGSQDEKVNAVRIKIGNGEAPVAGDHRIDAGRLAEGSGRIRRKSRQIADPHRLIAKIKAVRRNKGSHGARLPIGDPKAARIPQLFQNHAGAVRASEARIIGSHIGCRGGGADGSASRRNDERAASGVSAFPGVGRTRGDR